MTEKQIQILNETLDYLNNYPEEAKALIVGEAGVFLGTKTTVMCITLTDGWEIVGMSSPLDKNDFNNQLILYFCLTFTSLSVNNVEITV